MLPLYIITTWREVYNVTLQARFARHPRVFASLADVPTNNGYQRRAQRTLELVGGERSEPVPTHRQSLLYAAPTHQACFARDANIIDLFKLFVSHVRLVEFGFGLYN